MKSSKLLFVRYNNFMITSTALSTASNTSLPASIDECYERTERVALFEVVEVRVTSLT